MSCLIFEFIFKLQIIPIDPAVKPITRKKANSKRSLGRELTIKLS